MARRERVLITGGAGFVGSHLADALAASGHSVQLFDNLEPQVHGTEVVRPPYLSPEHELVRGDVRDARALAPLVRGADVVFHFAARVGVGQSMYEIERYTDVNVMGTAALLQTLVENRGNVRKLIVASSMSIYGEGSYRCPECGPVAPGYRSADQLAAHEWEPRCPRCRSVLAPLPTAEDKPLMPSSVYAINKRDQEEMCLSVGSAYRIPTVALRFFNIYGPRQALSNPYTGVAAIFSSRLRAGRPPVIFEDGRQLRDFVHVSDVVQGCMLSMDSQAADYEIFNLGSGQPLSVLDVASILARELRWDGSVEITEKFRAGDIRHCFADISRIQQKLGYRPRVCFSDGARELVDWVEQQQRVSDAVGEATAQLVSRGLVS